MWWDRTDPEGGRRRAPPCSLRWRTAALPITTPSTAPKTMLYPLPAESAASVAPRTPPSTPVQRMSLRIFTSTKNHSLSATTTSHAALLRAWPTARHWMRTRAGALPVPPASPAIGYRNLAGAVGSTPVPQAQPLRQRLPETGLSPPTRSTRVSTAPMTNSLPSVRCAFTDSPVPTHPAHVLIHSKDCYRGVAETQHTFGYRACWPRGSLRREVLPAPRSATAHALALTPAISGMLSNMNACMNGPPCAGDRIHHACSARGTCALDPAHHPYSRRSASGHRFRCR